MERRLKFAKGQQEIFVKNAVKNCNSMKMLAEKINIPVSTLKKYAYGSLLMPEVVFLQIIKFSTLSKKDVKFTYLNSNWGKSKGGKKGMKTLKNRYPDKIKKWREKGISKIKFTNLKEIKEPIINESLAELFGAYLGDGTLTKYFIRISGDSRYDVSYFNYLNNLVYKIFGIEGKISKNKLTNNLYFTIFSKKICDFFNKSLSVNYGDKLRNNTLIPELFLNNKSLASACLRGLIDTDGCVSLRGQSFSVSFYSKNPNLIKQIKSISNLYDIFTYISKNEDEIGTNSNEKILAFFRNIGSSNLRHIVRFYQKFIYKESVYQNQVLEYYQKGLYRDMNLPFKLVGPIG